MSNVNTTVARIEEILASHGMVLVNEAKVSTGEYPFLGQKQVKAVLEADYDLQEQVIVLMHQLQTEQEQSKRDTEVRNKVGFMSSHAWHGSRIAEALQAGAILEHDDIARVSKMAVVYSKQMAVQLRRLALVRDPKLAGLAAQFSAN